MGLTYLKVSWIFPCFQQKSINVKVVINMQHTCILIYSYILYSVYRMHIYFLLYISSRYILIISNDISSCCLVVQSCLTPLRPHGL